MGEPFKCKLKCFEKVTEEEKQEVFMNIRNKGQTSASGIFILRTFYEYWEQGKNKRKWDFHLNHVINSAKQRCRTNSKESRRSMTREYSIGGKRVCKVICLNTLGMTSVFRNLSKKI